MATAKANGLNTLVEASQYSGLASSLPLFKTGTVFAPTDAAFQKLAQALNVTAINQIPKANVTKVRAGALCL